MAKEGFGLEITELRLGLPGGGPDHNQYSSSCGTVVLEKKAEKKRVFSDMISDENSSNVGHKKVNNHQSSCNKMNTNTSTNNNNNNSGQQIVGWPPVRSYRKKNNSTNYYASAAKDQENTSESEKLYVKVSMDGIPYLRKIDLNTHEAYSDLALAFQKLFGCYGIVDGGILRDSENSEYIPIYEDKDGDWMLVGDVPWEMFIESCKRLRIMKRTEKGKSFAVEQRNFKGQVEGAGEVGGAEWNRIGL